MDKAPVFEQQSPLSSNDTLLITFIIAVIVHVVLILGLNFNKDEPQKISRSIDITLAATPAKKAPEEAKFLAQANQVGAGEEVKKPQPPKQQIASQGHSEHLPPKPKPAQEESKPKSARKVLTQHQAEQSVTAEVKSQNGDAEERPHITAEALKTQIAQLGAEIRARQQSADNTKIKFANAVSTHQFLAAQYMQDWENKVERTGNLNYPKVAAKKNFSGILTMDVGIKADGSIYSIRISKSSGNPALDEAAKNIVRISAPFAPLPVELRKELDVLVITRVWKFSDESGISAE